MPADALPDHSTVEVCRCGNTATSGLGPDTYWFASNDLFNEVNGSPNGFMCPACFTTAAAKAGTPVGWRAGRVGEVEEADRLRAENEALREALVGHDPLDPRWTWLHGVIERLEAHAAADEDPEAMYEAARVLQAMVHDLGGALASDEQGATLEPWQSGTSADVGNINFPPGQDPPPSPRTDQTGEAA